MSSEIISLLNRAGQTKLAQYLESASAEARDRIEAQVRDIDLDELPGVKIEHQILHRPTRPLPALLADFFS